MGQDEVLVLINRAAAEGWTELDLSGKGLREISKAIADLRSYLDTNDRPLELNANLNG